MVHQTPGVVGSRDVASTAAVIAQVSAGARLGPLSPPASRTELVAAAIKQAILEGDLLPGQQIVERELAAALGVSKTPVREALKTLVGTGLVSVHPYHGVTVRRVDRGMVQSLYQVRSLLEPAAIALAVPYQDEETLTAARTSFETAAAAAAAEEWPRLSLLNRDFHALLYARCPNPLLISILEGLRDQVALAAVTAWARQPTWDTEASEHEAILQAVTHGQAERAEVLARRHLVASVDRLLSSTPGLEADPEGSTQGEI